MIMIDYADFVTSLPGMGFVGSAAKALKSLRGLRALLQQLLLYKIYIYNPQSFLRWHVIGPLGTMLQEIVKK